MRQINVPIEDSIYERGKEAALAAGMLFRAWVARAIREAADREQKLKERFHAPEPK